MLSTGTPPARPGAGYQRSKGSPRGEARRQELLELITADLAANGLADFSLRRAARAAGTTHKVLLYHFEGSDDLLRQSVERLRDRRLTDGLAAAEEADGTLGSRIRAVWPTLVDDQVAPVLDQALGLAMADPARHAHLADAASGHFLPGLMALCPPDWTAPRRREVAEMIFATLRGFLVERRTTGDADGIAAGLNALVRALDREERAGS